MADKFANNVRKNTVSELIRNGISFEEATAETDILIEHVFNLKKKDIICNPTQELPDEKLTKFYSLIYKRISERIPVQYLTNRAHFMGHDFYVDKNVLIPRPETEILVNESLALIKILQEKITDRKIKVIDIGTGSGCIACMIAKNSENTEIIASDISEKALEIAETNVKNLEIQSKISFIKSNLLENIDEKFDFIVSNPPYIPEEEKENLQIEVVQHEPHLALFAEDEEGIDFYKRIIEQSETKLNSGGFLAFEIGISQSELIKNILEEKSFKKIKIIRDFNNIDRVIIAEKF